VSATESDRGAMRRAARLAAVQALYQWDLTAAPIGDIEREFLTFRLDTAEKGGAVDRVFFAQILRGAAAECRSIDPMIAGALTTGWSVERLDRVLRAILRAGVFELWRRSDVPSGAVINEYVEIAHAFFTGPEPGLINAVLDRLASLLREKGGEPPLPRDGAD